MTPQSVTGRGLISRYQVVDLSIDGFLAALQDANGQLHVARLMGCRLHRGDALQGSPASLGTHHLHLDARLAPLRLRFERVGCSQDDALLLLHPGRLP
jgi:hypothetical protein